VIVYGLEDRNCPSARERNRGGEDGVVMDMNPIGLDVSYPSPEATVKARVEIIVSEMPHDFYRVLDFITI
jgi:hypothetical protein